MIHPGKALITTATELLLQLKGVLKQLDDSLFSQNSELLSGASVGSHVRHSLEFFNCLVEEVKLDEVNYDLRKRDVEIETNKKAAASLASDMIEALSTVSSDAPMFLSTKLNGENGAELKLATSLYRELWYTIEHAIHHFAIIKIGIKHQDPNFQFPENFGVASSTMIYQKP